MTNRDGNFDTFSQTAIGARLREERERIGYSQAHVAHLLNYPRVGYAKAEAGKGNFKISVLVHVARLGVDAQYVVTGVRSINLADVAAKIDYAILAEAA